MNQAPPVEPGDDVAMPGPESDISLGRELRRAREVRGVTIEQIAAETRINERYLHALENDRIDLLPGTLYGRNFVRAYARMIGADEEELLDYFNYQVRLQQEATGGPAPTSLRTTPSRRPILVVVGIGVALAIALMALSLRGRGDDSVAAAATPAPTKAPALPGTVAVGEPTTDFAGVSGPSGLVAGGATGTLGAPVLSRALPPVLAGGATAPITAAPTGPTGPTAPTGPSGIEEGPAPRLRLTFTGRSWVEVQKAGSDGYEALGLHDRGEVIEVALDSPVTITLNPAGAADLTVDGQPGKPLGGARESRRLTIDRANYRSFLQ